MPTRVLPDGTVEEYPTIIFEGGTEAASADTLFQPPSLTDDQRDAFALIAASLAEVNLSGLDSFITDLIIEHGALAEEMLYLELPEQQAFKDRFPGLDLGDGTLPGVVGGLEVQIQKYLEYEEFTRELLGEAGLTNFFAPTDDAFNDFVTNALVGEISARELQARIESGFQQVLEAPAEVQQFFAETFGADGDAALAAYFLDPERTEGELLRQVEQAELGGAAAFAGFDITGQRAQELRDLDLTDSFGGALERFNTAAARRHLTRESVSETTDLTEDDAVSAAFGDFSADELFRRRAEARIAAFSGGGRAASSNQGIFGLGTARS